MGKRGTDYILVDLDHQVKFTAKVNGKKWTDFDQIYRNGREWAD